TVADLSTLTPVRFVARRDPNPPPGETGTFTLAATHDGGTTTDRVRPPMAGYDAVTRSLRQRPMKPGEQRTEVIVLDFNPPVLRQWNVTLRATAREQTEVLGKPVELLRVEADASVLGIGE